VQSPFEDQVLSGVGLTTTVPLEFNRQVPAKSDATLKSKCSLQPEKAALD